MEIWRQTLTLSVSMSKRKNIAKKPLQLQKKSPAREQKLHAVNAKEDFFFHSVNLSRLKTVLKERSHCTERQGK